MKIKSYFAPSVQEAMEKARVELGPDAMLMSSKKTGAEARRLGAYEVVFGLSNEASAGQAAAPERAETRVIAGGAPAGGSDALARELADLRKQIENVRRSVSRQGYSRTATPLAGAGLSELHDMLVNADFSEDLAHELIESVSARTPELDATDQLSNLLRDEIERRLQVSPELGVRGAEQRVVALVGPSGAGKTTTLVKLALKYGI